MQSRETRKMDYWLSQLCDISMRKTHCCEAKRNVNKISHQVKLKKEKKTNETQSQLKYSTI